MNSVLCRRRRAGCTATSAFATNRSIVYTCPFKVVNGHDARVITPAFQGDFAGCLRKIQHIHPKTSFSSREHSLPRHTGTRKHIPNRTQYAATNTLFSAIIASPPPPVKSKANTAPSRTTDATTPRKQGTDLVIFQPNIKEDCTCRLEQHCDRARYHADSNVKAGSTHSKRPGQHNIRQASHRIRVGKLMEDFSIPFPSQN